MIKPKLLRSDIDLDPNLEWNSFISFLVDNDYDDLDAYQKRVWLCFWYDSEVQNGGHLQYFENRDIKYVNETINALKEIDATAQSVILETALDKFRSKKRGKIRSVFIFVKKALEEEYGNEDTDFYKLEPNLIELITIYFNNNKERFIEVI